MPPRSSSSHQKAMRVPSSVAILTAAAELANERLFAQTSSQTAPWISLPPRLDQMGGKVKTGKPNPDNSSAFEFGSPGPIDWAEERVKNRGFSARMSERVFYASSAAALFLRSDEGSPCLLRAEGTGCISFGSFSLYKQRKWTRPPVRVPARLEGLNKDKEE